MKKREFEGLPQDAERPNRFARQHGRFEVIETEVRDNAGLITTKALKRVDECALDRLYLDGTLGRPASDEARRRYAAGMGLRELHHEAGLAAPIVCGYGRGSRGHPEMTEAQVDAFHLFAGSMRVLAGYAEVVQRVCVWDRGTRLFASLRSGLDRLADWRGL